MGKLGGSAGWLMNELVGCETTPILVSETWALLLSLVMVLLPAIGLVFAMSEFAMSEFASESANWTPFFSSGEENGSWERASASTLSGPLMQ